MSEYGTKPTRSVLKRPCGHEWLPYATERRGVLLNTGRKVLGLTGEDITVTKVFCRFCLEIRPIGPASEEPDDEKA